MKPKTVSQDVDSKIIMQGIHLELTEAMQNIIHEKVGRLLGRNERIVRINIRIRQDQRLGTEHHYTATGQIEINGPDLVATVEGKEVYDLIDQLVEKLDHLLHRRHGLRKDHRNHPHDVELSARLPKLDDGEEA
ncbi:MAG TPA: HPF/RaiA family ribosome-associated protein [Opitutaceae bacterium]|nr:HPF/RaiA family ribosome-associated protein [Opitutaceae bacterium]